MLTSHKFLELAGPLHRRGHFGCLDITRKSAGSDARGRRDPHQAHRKRDPGPGAN